MIKIKGILRKTGVIILTTAMLAGQTGFTALAEEVAEVEEAEDKALDNEDSSAEEQTTGGETEIEKEDTDSTKDTVSYDNADPEKESVSEDRAERKNFEESRTLSSVTITVEAEEDVFPEDSVLSVKKANYIKEKQADKAVEEERPEDQNVAVSYTYDIKVLDKDGNEIQPADEAEVKVSFKTEEVADDNLTTNVYHITEKEESRTENTEGGGSSEMVVEKLTVETEGDTATAETDGFSLYTVEFTYNDLQYVMPGDSEIALSEILDKVSLTGEVTRVEVSSPELFSAEKNDSGEWIVTAHRAFSSEEWMKVTINDKEYKITVTDDSNIMSFADLKAQLAAGGEITLSRDYESETTDTGLEIPSGKTVTLDLNDHYILYKGTANAPVITVNGSLTLKDSKTPKTTRYVTLADGRAMGVSESNTSGAIEVTGGFIAGGNNVNQTGGGVYVNNSCMFTMEGGTIAGCKAGNGGGVNVNSSGMFTMEGGTIAGCKALSDGGGVFINNTGNFNMNGGSIKNCTATGSGDKRGGGSVYVSQSGKFNMEGGSITDCTADSGGGVFVFNSGKFNMEGGSITDCTANSGGGVYVYGGTFKVSGTPVIRDNKKGSDANNVALNNSKCITVTGALTTGAEIRVNASNGSKVAVPGAPSGSSPAYTITDTDAACFHSDLGAFTGGVHESNVVFKEEVYISGISAENKVYDGNKSATVTGTATLKKVNGNADVSGLTVSNITAEFEDKNAGDNKAVTITGGTLSHTFNYILVPGATTGLTANITPKPLTITGLSAKDKTYDTTTAATVTGTSVINGKIGNDTVTVSAGTAAFDNANVGNNKTVTFSGFGLSGADSGNYILSAQPDNATANITKGTPTISTVPTVNAITYGQALSAVGFNGGVAKINGTEVTGSYAWVNGTITPSVSDSNRTGYDVRFTPTDTSNLNTTTCKVKLTVNKADPVVTPPAAKTGLEYSGLSQALVTQGSTTGGTMQYALGQNNTTAPSGGWSTVIPTGIDTGTYYVWSRIEGNANFNSIPAAFACSVSIAKNSHHPAVALDAVIRADDTREIDLSSGIEKGGAPGSPSKTDNDNIIDGSPTVNGKTLSFKAVNSEDIIDKSATITVPVENAKNYGTYNIVVTVKGIDKYTQELTFEKASVTLKAGETFTNGLSGAETNVSYKSSDEKVATVDSSGKVTAVNDGTATITATAEETEDYFSASAEYTVKVEGGAGDKVPLTDPGESYAAPEDNFAPVTSGGSGESGGDIKKLVLDFSNVAESNVDPAGLKMTVINGSKLVTKGKLKDKDSAKVSGGVKVKVDKKTLIPKITCKKSGSVTLTMEDGTTYTINFTVEKPKAQKAAKKVSKGGEPVTKTVTDLFGTHIDAGKLSIVKQKHSQARVMDNKLIVDPKEKDSIKLRYNYLNKKYNITIKIK